MYAYFIRRTPVLWPVSVNSTSISTSHSTSTMYFIDNWHNDILNFWQDANSANWRSLHFFDIYLLAGGNHGEHQCDGATRPARASLRTQRGAPIRTINILAVNSRPHPAFPLFSDRLEMRDFKRLSTHYPDIHCLSQLRDLLLAAQLMASVRNIVNTIMIN